MLIVGIRDITAQGIQYREYAPDASLAEDVEYLWTMRASLPLALPLTQTSASKWRQLHSAS